MLQYDVHAYVVIKKKITGVEAANHQDAITNALKSEAGSSWIRQLYRLTDGPGKIGCYAEDLTDFVVDLVGDTDYSQTRHFRCSGSEYVELAREIQNWAAAGPRQEARLNTILAEVAQKLKHIY